MYMHMPGCPQRQEVALDPLEPEVTDVCKSRDAGAGAELWSSERAVSTLHF